MGMEITVERPGPLGAALARLAASGSPCVVLMVDGALTSPGAPLPDGWRDLRVRTGAGMLTLRRHGGAVAVVAFGNADPALQEAQRALADALTATGG